MKWSARIALLLIMVVLPGCSAQEGAAEPAVMLAKHSGVESAAFQTYWEAQLPLRGDDKIDRCYLRDDNLYVTSRDGFLFALKADQGLLRWMEQVTRPNYTIFPPQHLQYSNGKGPVVVTTTSRLLILDRYSGDTLKSWPMRFAPATSFVGDESLLFAGGRDSSVYAVWWHRTVEGLPMKRWELAAASALSGTPIFRDGVLYAATRGGQAASCSAADKGFGWRTRLGPVQCDIAADETRVYVASLDNSLYALHRGTGAILWRTRFQHFLTEAPVVKGSTVYLSCPAEGLYAVDAGDGHILWNRGKAVAFLSEAEGDAVLLTESGRVEVVRHDTGEVLRSFEAGGVHASTVNVEDDAVYLAYSDGHVVCHRTKSVPYLRHQEVEAAKGMLNRPPLDRAANQQNAAAPRPAAAYDPLRSDRDPKP